MANSIQKILFLGAIFYVTIYAGCDVVPYHFGIADAGADAGNEYVDTDVDADTDTGTDTNSDTDTDTDNDTDIDIDTDTDSDTDTDFVDAGNACTGEIVLDYCWHAAPKGVACDEYCESHGAQYEEATCDIAGNIDIPNHCRRVIEAIVSEDSDVHVTVSPVHASIGCSTLSLTDWEIYGVVDTIGCEPDTKHGGRHRFCACSF